MTGSGPSALPELASALPVRVPVPVVAGGPDQNFPWPWSAVPWLAGEVAGDQPRAAAAAWAPELADFLAALHRPAPPEAPTNPVRAVPLAARTSAIRERAARGEAAGTLTRAEGLAANEAWRRGLAASPWPGPPLWVHGDPHPNNLLVTPGGAADGSDRLVAVLDWGDLSGGDPACDLATAWLTFDAEGRAAFREDYRESAAASPFAAQLNERATWDRAAAMATSVLVDAPGDERNATWARAALGGLAAV